MAASLTTCGPVLSLFTAFPSPQLAPAVPEEGAHCAPPSIRLVMGRSGAVGEDYVGLGSFPPALIIPAPAAPAFAATSFHTYPLCLHCRSAPFLQDLVSGSADRRG